MVRAWQPQLSPVDMFCSSVGHHSRPANLDCKICQTTDQIRSNWVSNGMSAILFIFVSRPHLNITEPDRFELLMRFQADRLEIQLKASQEAPACHDQSPENCESHAQLQVFLCPRRVPVAILAVPRAGSTSVANWAARHQGGNGLISRSKREIGVVGVKMDGAGPSGWRRQLALGCRQELLVSMRSPFCCTLEGHSLQNAQTLWKPEASLHHVRSRSAAAGRWPEGQGLLGVGCPAHDLVSASPCRLRRP